MQNKEQRKIFLIIRTFVNKKTTVLCEINTKLYSSGLLDSLDMLSLFMYLEEQGYELNYEIKNINDKLNELDSIQDIIGYIK